MAYLANFEEINQEKCDSSKVFQFLLNRAILRPQSSLIVLSPWNVREYSTAPAGACQHSQAKPA